MAAKSDEPSQDVPVFLRKTYHMINTCDPEIAGWSDDGETFVVKDPQRFQETCIPAYFKHSKFSSFVRQLNFYSFRKIKYADTIRIDPKLEAETSNYWRFRHEKFRRGHPELLTEIKRMNGQKSTPKEAPKQEPSTSEDKNTKSEVQSLKKRIEEMSKNMDELTAMVEKVKLKQDEKDDFAEDADVGAKRKKLYPTAEEAVKPDEMLSNMELEEMTLPALSMPSPMATRTNSDTTQISDNEFVDELFNAFNEDENGFLELDVDTLEPARTQPDADSNRPDAELMERLSEALALLPKDIQVLIVDRLIAAITSTDGLKNPSIVASDVDPKKVAASGKALPAEAPQTSLEGEKQQEPAFPLAAATLAALLHHYSSQVKGKSPKSVHKKSIPVIPVHA